MGCGCNKTATAFKKNLEKARAIQETAGPPPNPKPPRSVRIQTRKERIRRRTERVQRRNRRIQRRNRMAMVNSDSHGD